MHRKDTEQSCNKIVSFMESDSKLLSYLPWRFRARKNRAMKNQDHVTPPRMTIRLPSGLHQEISDAAARAGHSMNAEIILRLTRAPSKISLDDISRQNVRTQKMLQQIIDALC
jgi:hypothetical protein